MEKDNSFIYLVRSEWHENKTQKCGVQNPHPRSFLGGYPTSEMRVHVKRDERKIQREPSDLCI